MKKKSSPSYVHIQYTLNSYGLVIASLIHFNYYKLAFIEFGYFCIKNSLFIEKKFNDYLIQKDRFNKYYKKRFPIIEILSGLRVYYTGYLLRNTLRTKSFLFSQTRNSTSSILI